MNACLPIFLLAALSFCSCAVPTPIQRAQQEQGLAELQRPKGVFPNPDPGWQLGPDGRAFDFDDGQSADFRYEWHEKELEYMWTDGHAVRRASFEVSFALEKMERFSIGEYVLAGFDKTTGETVIELWSIASGREAEANKPPRVTLRYRGQDFLIQDFMADPDGRYLVVLDELSGNLLKVTDCGSQVLLEAKAQPWLLHTDEMELLEGETHDRLIMLHDSGHGPDHWIILQDIENDTEFESVSLLGWEDLAAKFPIYSFEGKPPTYIWTRR